MDNQRNAFAIKVLTELVKNNYISEFSVLTKRLNTAFEEKGYTLYSRATIYRLLDQLHIHKKEFDELGTKYYMFDDTVACKPSELTRRYYNNTLYYTVNPSHAPLIAELLNHEFDQKIFNAVPIGNMIICFYYYQKEPEEHEYLGKDYLTKSHLNKKIPSIIAQSPYYSLK